MPAAQEQGPPLFLSLELACRAHSTGQQPIELGKISGVGCDRLHYESAEEGVCVFAPDSVRSTVIRDEGAGELLDVVVVCDLAEQIPLPCVAIEGIAGSHRGQDRRSGADTHRPDRQ